MHPRLYLITPPEPEADRLVRDVEAALSGGDVACLLIADDGRGEAAYQALAERLVPLGQAAGAAVLLHNDTRVAGRARADGVHVDSGTEDLERALKTFRPDGIVGVGDLRGRHDAMTVAELGVDYVFFGLLERSADPEPHDKTLKLAGWWTEVFETPCVALSGADFAGIETCAATGADFVAVREAVWAHPQGPQAAVAAANEILARFDLADTEDA
ncbi:thiamine phosphate synthase [Stappia sp.]|uniref:thiamine phosphate synthase n=1 Tax=Stappia sp. TaxID=1870903 RepID=UPI0032D924B5